jgi:glycosyltransferase involved in cell wall biosynthesis
MTSPTLWYLPIESYEERYTNQLDSWIISKLKERNISFVKVDGGNTSNSITHGQVLDTIGRPQWCLNQSLYLLEQLKNGNLKNNDRIFTLDVWQFGIESLFYAAQQRNIHLDLYAFNCAGTFEPYDFLSLNNLSPWGRHLERTWFTLSTKIFFASEKLRNMAYNAQMFDNPSKAVITGLAFNSKYVLDQVGYTTQDKAFNPLHKSKTVVFPHRYDFEKNPDVFLDIVEKLQGYGINFIITTGRKELYGTANYLRAQQLESEGKLKIYSGLSKKSYYELLLNSMIIFSSAKQDTIGNSILEAITLGCTPVVNTGVSYEEFLPKKYIYTDGSINEACELILKYIDRPSNAYNNIKRYDESIDKMLNEMGY